LVVVISVSTNVPYAIGQCTAVSIICIIIHIYYYN